MKIKQTKGRFNVLERAKVDAETADFISKEALKMGCSRSQVVRDALNHYMSYESSQVLAEVKEVRDLTESMNERLIAIGQYEQSRFDQLLKAVKAYRRPV